MKNLQHFTINKKKLSKKSKPFFVAEIGINLMEV